MADTLMISYDQYLLNTSETSSGEGKFDHSLFATHGDIERGYPVTDDDVPTYTLTEGEGGFRKSLGSNPARKFSSRLNSDTYVFDWDIFSESVVLTDETKVSVRDYDTIIVSHKPFHLSYVRYLGENYPEKTLIGLQTESTMLATTGSAKYTLEHYHSLQHYDGFVATTNDYLKWVSGIVENTTLIPVFVPPNHFRDFSPKDSQDRRNAVLIGGTSWNLDYENIYSNFVVLDALRERGHEVNGEIAGIRKYQVPKVKQFADEYEFMSIYPFLVEDDDFYEYLSGCNMAILLSQNRSWGRLSAELAAFNIPCIGSKYNTYQSECWPDLSIEPTNVTEAISLGERLLEDDEFYSNVVKKANEAVQEFQEPSQYVSEFTSFIDSLN